MKSTRRSQQLGRVVVPPAQASKAAAAPVAPLAPVAHASGAAQRLQPQRPRSLYTALEARILFDAAGMAAADAQLDDSHTQAEAQRMASEQESATQEREHHRMLSEPASPAATNGSTLVVVDSRVANYQSLLEGIDPQATVRILGADENGLEVIGKLVGANGNVSSLQIISHGQSGAIRLGNVTLDSIALNDAAVAAELQGWQSGMTAGADILLLGCDVAEGSKGQHFVQQLADLTRADISASVDDTGATAKGGNWVLEFNVGERDSYYAFSQQSIESYGELFAAGPTTTLSLPASTLIGATGQNGSVTFSNEGTSIGYSPYVAVAFNSSRTAPSALDPSTNVNEGITYTTGSATYLGSALADTAVLTFDGSGNASSPLVVNPVTGLPIIFSASDYGMGAGDTLVIYQLPYGSFTPSNPAAKIDFKYNLGVNADSSSPVSQGGEGAPAANIASRGFFLLGETPVADNEPVIFQSSAAVATTNPLWYRTAYINSSREGEQVPGANDKQYFIAELEIAPGQTVRSNNGAINATAPGLTTNRYVSRLSIPNNINFDPAVDVSLNYNPAGTVASPSDPAIAGAQIFVVDKVTGIAAGQPGGPVRDSVLGTWSSAGGVELIAIAPAGQSYTGGVLGLELNYFIPDTIISPTTGADVPQFFDAKHTGNVRFADSDDPQNAPFTIDPAQIRIEYETIQIQKAVVGGVTANAIDPANPAGVRSGDTVTYEIVVQVGDFYGLRDAVITDTLADGLAFNTGSMSIVAGNVNGQATAGIAIAPTVTTSSANDFSSSVTVDVQADEAAAAIDVNSGVGGVQVGGIGKQVLQFNLSSVIAGVAANAGLTGAVAGDLIGDAFGNAAGAGLTTLTIRYTATVLDNYRVPQNGNITTPTGLQVLENDILPNSVRISGTLLRDNDATAGADIESTNLINADESGVSITVKDGKLIQEIYAINGVLVGSSTIPKDPQGRPIIAAGDNVTYRLRYNLSQGDFNTLKLEGFLPDPIFQANDSDLNGSVNNFAAVTAPTDLTTGNASSNWAQAGVFTLGPNHNQADITLTNLATDVITSVTAPASGNSVGFEVFKSSSVPIASSTGNVVDFLFTVKASDKPYADNLLLTSQGRETGQRSVNNNNGGAGNAVLQPTPLPDDQIIQIVRAEPRLTVSHGVIAKIAGQGGDITGNTNLGTVPDALTGTGTSPFSGTLTEASQINGNVTNVDAGDTLRMGFAIQNTGGAGAFDVKTTPIAPPPGYRFVSNTQDAAAGANNLQVRTGAGALLVAGTDYSITTVGSQTVIELIDGTNTAKLGAGRNPDGTTVADGSNILVITYDIVADDGTPARAVAADNATSVLAVDSYASRNAGTDFTTTLNAATGGQVSDAAQLEIARPTVDIRWQGDNTDGDKTATDDDSNQAHTTGADLVIGEKAFFDLKVTVPEGITNNLFADINLPAGLKLDTTYNGDIGYEIISTAAGTGVNGQGINGQLASDFVGTGTTAAAAGNIAGNGGTLGDSGVGARVALGTITNTADNNASNNSFIVRVRVVVDNAATNQQGATKTGTSDAVFTDTDGATGNGTSEVRDIVDATTANDPTITIVEPTVTTVKTMKIVDIDTATSNGDQEGTEADENDVVEFTILLTNSSLVKAWDLSLSDTLPSQFGAYTLVSVDSPVNPNTLTTSAGAFRNGTAQILDTSDFAITTAGVLSFNSANTYDLDPAGTIRVTVRGTANASIAAFNAINNDATTRWTSLDRSSSAAGDNNTIGNTPGGERGGSTGLLAGSGVSVGNGTTSGTGANQATSNSLNDYRTTSRAVVPVVPTNPVLSRIGGLSDTSPLANNNAGGDTSAGSPTVGVAQNMSVGEVTRFRMVTRVPAGAIADFALTPTLPAGYEFLNDGNARVALVSDSGMSASGLTDNGVSARQGDGSGTGSTAAFGTIQNDLTSANFSTSDPRTAGTSPTVAITPNVATNGGSLTAPRFELGTLTNGDNDTDFEYVVIEFNAIVKNDIANQTATNLDTRFIVTTGAAILGTSNTTRDIVVEPNISNLSKQIVDIPAGLQNSTTPGSYTVTVQNSFTSNGGTTAYDTQFRDSIPGATSASDVLISLDGGFMFISSASFTSAALGRSVTVTGGVVDVSLGDVPVGTNVVIKYDTVVPSTATPQAADNLTRAQVVFSSIPDVAANSIGAVGFGGSTIPGADGAGNGERNGELVAQTASPTNDIVNDTLLNNYRNVDPAGYGSISGVLWDDTANPNGAIDGGEALLAGVTVTLTWAGADGIAGNTDDRVITTVTNTNGEYTFGALPNGAYTITAPTTTPKTDVTATADPDSLAVRTDADAGTLGTINSTIAEATTIVVGTNNNTTRNFGYVQPNDAPTNRYGGSTTFPTAPLDTIEDTPFPFTASSLLTIADPDGGQGDGLLSTTVAVGNGTLAADGTGVTGAGASFTGSGTPTITIVGTQAQINAALASLIYTPDNNFSGSDILTMTTNDRGQGGDADSDLNPRETGGTGSEDALIDRDVINLNVQARSDAPILTIGTPSGTVGTSPGALGTGLGNSPTQTVAGSTNGREDTPIDLGIVIASADTVGTSEAISSVTITGIPAGWVLRDSSGNDITAAATSAAGLTAAQANGATITPRTDVHGAGTPSATLTVIVRSQDGTAAVATTTGTLTVGVIPVNDRPVATNPTVDVVIPSVAEDSTNPPGQSVATLFNPRFSDLKDAGQPNGADTMIGVVLTLTAANPTTEGVWQYSTNNGGSWTDYTSTTADTNAVFLSSTATGAAINLVRFVPVANFSGDPGKLTVRLVENDQTPAGTIVADVANGGASGTTVGTGLINTTPGNSSDISIINGGLSGDAIFAVGQVSNPLLVATRITPVSDAPNVSTPAVTGLEDQPIPLGIVVTPTDTSGTPEVITVRISNIPAGWILSNGATPVPVSGGVATLTGLMPAEIAALTITPATDANSIGATPLANLTVTVTSKDGVASASAPAVTTLAVSVTPVNDRPVATGGNIFTAPSGNTVANLFNPRFTDPKDAAKPNGVDSLIGVVIVGNDATPTQGKWQYSANNGMNWVDIPTSTSDSTALYLSSTDTTTSTNRIRFVPAAGFTGSPGQLTVRLVENDQTFVVGGKVPDVPNGAANATTIGTTDLNTVVGTASDIFGPVNDAAQFAVGQVSNTIKLTTQISPPAPPPPPPPPPSPPTIPSSATGLEDQPISLGITGGNSNPNTTVGITIGNIPTGWILKDANGAVVPIADGSTILPLSAAQLSGLTLTPPPDLNSIPGAPAFVLNITTNTTVADTTTSVTNNVPVFVTPVNDRPVASAAPVDLGTVAQGTPSSAAQTVATLFAPRFSDPKDAIEPNGADGFIGVLVTGTAANPATEGAWEYNIGGAWVPITVASDSAAIYLPSNAQIRFSPVSTFVGTPGQLTVRLVENDQGTTGGKVADVPNGAAASTGIGSALNATPGSSNNISASLANAAQFATGRVSEAIKLGITVTASASAPNVTTAPANGIEDQPIPIFVNASSSPLASLTAVTTVAISGIPTGWVIRDSAGNVIPTIDGTTPSLALSQLPGLIIVPASDVHSQNSRPAINLTVTATTRDGTAAPTISSTQLPIAIRPVNDAPAFTATSTTQLPASNTGDPSPQTTIGVAFPGFSDTKDAGEPNGADNRVGVVLTGNVSTPEQGNWQYFDGNSWIDVPRGLSDSNAIYLPDNTPIRFNPAPNFTGTPGNLKARLVENDQAGGDADLLGNTLGAGFFSGANTPNVIRSGLNLVVDGGVGGTSRISANTRDVGIGLLPADSPPPVVMPPAVMPPVGGVDVIPPAPLPAAPDASFVGLPTVTPQLAVLPPDLGEPLIGEFVGLVVQQMQAEAALREAAMTKQLNNYLGNSGLQPNWLAPDGVPGIDPFAAPLPVQQLSAVVPPSDIASIARLPDVPAQATKAAERDDCARPRVVAKPRDPVAAARAAAEFSKKYPPGSEAAKRFSEQLKKARTRARC